jgi:hypothetical protein
MSDSLAAPGPGHPLGAGLRRSGAPFGFGRLRTGLAVRLGIGRSLGLAHMASRRVCGTRR